ncbi:MAG: glycosyltransferase family 9 protein [candidate division KSB1 bacterium]|nr:glycosyltransferase family 9 protein [candidate division KSB1 bacterium]
MRRIVVSRLRFLGDVVLTTPLLRILKAKDRDVRIGYLVEEPYAPVLLHHPHVDVVWALKRRAGSLRREVGQVIQLRREVRAFRPDVSLDLLGMPRSALLLYLCGSPARIGGPYRVRRHLYTHVVQHAEPQISAVHYHLENLRPLGIQGPFAAEDLRTFVRVLPEEVAYVRRSFSLDRDRRPLIGLHPGATWPAKRWFPERFGALASALHSQLGARVVLTTGPGEEELVRRVVEAANGSAQALPVLGLRHLAALLSQLDAYVANDCGPMHLAVAVGTPTIGLFGPSEPRIWFPYRREEGHVALHHPCPAHPCHRDVCDHLSCFRDLPVQEVLEAVVWAVGRKTLAQKAISDLTSG